MNRNEALFSLIRRLETEHRLERSEYEFLLANRTPEAAARLADSAVRLRREIYGNDVYIRGLIEISSFCRNDCLYCGIRRSNSRCQRYRLTPEEILECCREGYELGFRTFVLQGGEDGWFQDGRLCKLIGRIRSAYPDCAVTLSLGERSRESYQRLFDAGAERYLLRHETASRAHYEKLHPEEMSYDSRMRCLRDLKEIGYQTGCGFMVGSPGQTAENLLADLEFIARFQPQMVGIGPFIPHRDTPLGAFAAGTVELTLKLLAIIRLLLPNVLLPATTALATLDARGCEKGMLAGANVVMPNLSPAQAREKYALYEGKATAAGETANALSDLRRRMESIGYRVAVARGDHRSSTDGEGILTRKKGEHDPCTTPNP